MTVDIANRRARLVAATSGPWSSKIDLLDEDDGLAFTITDATYKMFGILPTEFPNTPAGSASALKHPAAANASLIVGLVNEEAEILEEFSRLRADNEQQRKAYLEVADALLPASQSPQDLVAAAQRLRADHAACTCRRDREIAVERARWGTYRDNRAACPHEWEPHVWERGTFWCPLCSLTVSAEERTALAKENG